MGNKIGFRSYWVRLFLLDVFILLADAFGSSMFLFALALSVPATWFVRAAIPTVHLVTIRSVLFSVATGCHIGSAIGLGSIVHESRDKPHGIYASVIVSFLLFAVTLLFLALSAGSADTMIQVEAEGATGPENPSDGAELRD